jgi:hypothetical protein
VHQCGDLTRHEAAEQVASAAGAAAIRRPQDHVRIVPQGGRLAACFARAGDGVL